MGLGAGLSTAVLMISTVPAEFALPRLVARFGYRSVLAVGLVLVGAPALALPVSAGLPLVLTVCLLRGLGLAVIFVVCGALSAMLVPAERRGEGLGVFGVVASVPAVIGMPLGVWLAGEVGYAPVFVAAAITALSGLAVIRGLPGRTPSPGGAVAHGGRAAHARAAAPEPRVRGHRHGRRRHRHLPAGRHAGRAGVALALLAHTVATTVEPLVGRALRRPAWRHPAARAQRGCVTAAGMLTLVLVATRSPPAAGLVPSAPGSGSCRTRA